MNVCLLLLQCVSQCYKYGKRLGDEMEVFYYYKITRAFQQCSPPSSITHSLCSLLTTLLFKVEKLSFLCLLLLHIIPHSMYLHHKRKKTSLGFSFINSLWKASMSTGELLMLLNSSFFPPTCEKCSFMKMLLLWVWKIFHSRLSRWKRKIFLCTIIIHVDLQFSR